ncbi:MAG: glycosyltransferase, partial [Actinobacteria bacterium]|nr:glycosyltransferase [Actinomycetota bacterium]
PGWPGAEQALRRFAAGLPLPRSGRWKWPAERLTYANARIPEALIAAGQALDDIGLVDAGLELLDWLIETERGDRGFSFTPVGGRGPTDSGPAYDQQPIEAWAMADACQRAFLVSSNLRYLEYAWMAALWFVAHNDSGVDLYDPETGAGYDGLERDGLNLNRGAESTLAALGALQVLTPPRLLTIA